MRVHLVKTAKWAASLAIVLTSIMVVGPLVESRYFTPFDRINYSLVNVTASHVDIIVTGVKSRDCNLKSASGFSNISGETIHSEVIMLKQDGSKLDFQDQRISAGSPFVRLIRVSPGSDDVRVEIEATCHPLWSVKQTVVDLRK